MLTIALATGGGHESRAQPFGVDKGTPAAQLRVLRKVTQFDYLITPKTLHADFESYAVLATPKAGVCKVWANGFVQLEDTTGSKARVVFDRVGAQLTQKYGASKLTDTLLPTSIWKQPMEWTLSVSKHERTYKKTWLKDQHADWNNGLQAVTLQIAAVNGNKSYTTVMFEYDNVSECQAEIKAAGVGAL
jgi:hypothetical protein